MTFIARTERGGLPVAFGGEAVAVGHQPLRREAGQLRQAVQILKRRREALESALLEERAQAQFDARAVAERIVARAALAQVLRRRV